MTVWINVFTLVRVILRTSHLDSSVVPDNQPIAKNVAITFIRIGAEISSLDSHQVSPLLLETLLIPMSRLLEISLTTSMLDLSEENNKRI